jgi:predicted enzyme related to lactoylglutathione lyase
MSHHKISIYRYIAPNGAIYVERLSAGVSPTDDGVGARDRRRSSPSCPSGAPPTSDRGVPGWAGARLLGFITVTETSAKREKPYRSRAFINYQIGALRPGALARFYSELLGWPIGHEEPGTTILAAPEGSIYVVFQQATGYQAPVWPPVDGQRRPMMHFDFQVGDLDSAVAEAVALGASVAAEQPRDNVRVLFDPAGHPFCLCRDDG